MSTAAMSTLGASTVATGKVRSVPGNELSTKEFHAIMKLRVDVFVVEQQCPYAEIDGRDLEASTTHLWFRSASEDSGVSSYIRVLTEDAASSGPTFRIGRVVTHPDYRGAGLSSKLITSALAGLSITSPDAMIVLDAQSYLLGYYQGLGFKSAGEEYVEDGIPHIPMEMSLLPAEVEL